MIESGSGPPLLMLHGLFDSSQTWVPLKLFLERHFRCYAMDLPGFGESPLPEVWGEGISSMTNVLVSWIADLHQSKLTVIGSSMGGALALALAQKLPERISKVVLCNPYALPETPLAVHNARRPIVGALLPYVLGKEVFRVCTRSIYKRSLCNQALVTPELIARVTAPFATLKQRKNLFRFLRSISLEAISAVDEALPSLIPEVLVLWGTEDQWLGEQHWRRLKEKVPRVSVVSLSGCGHLPHYEAPEQVASHVLSFIKA